MTTSGRVSQTLPGVVAVVGASSSFGALLLAHLEAEWPDCQFVAIDTQPLRWPVRRMSAYRMDRNHSGGEILNIDDIPEVLQVKAWDMVMDEQRLTMADVLSASSVKSLIHIGSHYDGPDPAQFLSETASWVRACRVAGVRRVAYLSDVRVYGIGRHNPIPITELSQPNPAERHRFLLDAEPGSRQPPDTPDSSNDMSIAILRTAMTVGPSSSSPVTDELLVPSLVASKLKPNIPLQFLHHQDLLRATQYAVAGGLNGVHNVASNGIVASDEVMEMCRAPRSFVRSKYGGARRSGRSRLGGQPLILTSTKIRQAAGMRFKYTSTQAFRAYCHSILLASGSHDDF